MKKSKKSLGPWGLPRRLLAPSPGEARAPALSGNFSALDAVLEPQSRGVLVRDKLESRDASGGCPRFHGVRGRRSYDDAAFLGHSRDIERPLPASLFVISAGPPSGPSEREHLCGTAFPAIPLEEGETGGVQDKAFRVVDWGTWVEPQDVTRRLRA
jgi:hypothetical protein